MESEERRDEGMTKRERERGDKERDTEAFLRKEIERTKCMNDEKATRKPR